MSRGCWRRQPRVAQNSESLKISCCNVTRSQDYIVRASSKLAQDPGGFQLLFEMVVDEAPMRRLEFPRRAGVERDRRERVRRCGRGAAEKAQRFQGNDRPAPPPAAAAGRRT